MNNENLDQHNEPVKRPVFLKVLCILTYITTGLGVLSSFLTVFSKSPSEQMKAKSYADLIKISNDLKEQGAQWMSDLIANLAEMTGYMQEQFHMVQLTSLLISATGLIGAYLMWNAKRLGFHMYIIYSILGAISAYFFVPFEVVPGFIVIFNLLFSGVFVFMYSRNLSYLK